MTTTGTLSSDLAYIRDLAEAGQNAPLLGGRFLVMWGGLVTLAYLGHYAISQSAFGLPPVSYWWLWGGFGLAGGLGQLLMQRGLPSKPGLSSAGNRVQGVIWTAAGFLLFAFFAGVILRVLITGEGWEGFYWSVPTVLGLYGLGQLVTGYIAGRSALKFAGVTAFVGVAVAAFATGTNYIWLIGAGVAFVSVFIPGVMMLRREPAMIV
jgi:hypothetical protein